MGDGINFGQTSGGLWEINTLLMPIYANVPNLSAQVIIVFATPRENTHETIKIRFRIPNVSQQRIGY